MHDLAKGSETLSGKILQVYQTPECRVVETHGSPGTWTLKAFDLAEDLKKKSGKITKTESGTQYAGFKATF